MNKLRQVFHWLRAEKADTAETNTNKGLWWIAAIIAFAIVAGMGYYIVAHMVSQAQGGASTVTTSMSTQGGLTNLAQSAEAGSVSSGTSSVGNGFKTP